MGQIDRKTRCRSIARWGIKAAGRLVFTLSIVGSSVWPSPTASAAPLIAAQAPCATPDGWCKTFDGPNPTIPTIRTFSFNAPSRGKAAVTFHGSLYCQSFSFDNPKNIDLATQIVTTATAVPNAQGPGGLRFAQVMQPEPSKAGFPSDTFSLASTRIVPIAAAGRQTYYFRITPLLMDNETACYVYNAAFSVVFIP